MKLAATFLAGFVTVAVLMFAVWAVYGAELIYLLLAIISTNPQPDILRERVSCIHLNHVYAEHEDGDWVITRHTFSQFCFLTWDSHLQQHICEAWRMRKNDEQVTFNHNTGMYELRWKDGEVWRCVEALSYRESHTLYDWEVEQRQGVKPEQRRGLR